MSTKTRTTYTAITETAEETFSTKQSAIRFGEKTGEEFYVRTSGGAIVHDTRDAVVEEVDQPVDDAVSDSEADAQGPSKDDKAVRLSYREHGPKHFYRALTDHPLLVRGKDFTVLVPKADSARVAQAWDNALEALREFKKANAGYKRQSTKTDAGRKLRYEMEQEFLTSAMKKALR